MSRPLPLRLVALVALLLSLAFAGMSAASHADAAAPPPSFYGLSETGNATNSSYKWDRIATTGAKTIRVEFNWKRDFYGNASAVSCPSSPLPSGSISWSTIDAKVRYAGIRGIEILPYLTGSFCSQGYPEPGSAEMTAWQSFAEDLGDRYGPGGTFWTGDWDLTPSTYPAVPINTWEVGNEPNLPENNPSGTLDPQKYGKFLILTSAGVKTSQPSATVLLGGLTTAVGGSTSVTDFLNDVYNPNPSYPCCTYTASQLNAAYDGLSLHPYAIGSYGTTTVNYITAARTALNAKTSGFGADKPIWVTEFGWPRANNIVADCSSTATTTVTGLVQRQNLYQVLNWMMANHDGSANLKLASWQSDVDTNATCGTGPEVDPANYGVEYSKGKMGLTGPAILIQSHTPTFCLYVSYTSAPDCVTGPGLYSSPKIDQGLQLDSNVVAWVNYAGGISYCSLHSSVDCQDLSTTGATSSTDPGVSIDPTTGATRIIYRRSNGQLGVWARSSWTGAWSHSIKGSAGDIAADTSPGVYRAGSSGTTNLVTSVVFRNGTTGALMYQAETVLGWTTATAISGAFIDAKSTPSITRDAAGGSSLIAYRDPSGKVGYTAYLPGTGWVNGSLGTSGSVDAGSSPAIARDTAAGDQAIVYRTNADKLASWHIKGGSWTWVNTVSGTTIPADADPSLTVDEVGGQFVSSFRDTSDGVSTWTRSSGGTWGTPTAITTISPPVVPLVAAAATDPTISVTNNGTGLDYFVPYTNGSNSILLQQMAFLSGSGGTWSVPIMP
ncbi:MAG: hypothetical protein J0H98_11625 [Solirubrobacterales bacterium]|nr:hypothetical protein [Solirubrobacterales bacterium]